MNEFPYSKMFYPNFKFQHPMSILVVGPTNSGKTYFVDQLLSNLNEKMNFKNPNLKCRISWFYGQWQQCYSDQYAEETWEMYSICARSTRVQ